MARGYIRKRGTNRRQLTWDVPRGPDGKRKQRYETVRGAKKQTQARITEIDHALNHGTYAEPSKVLLGDYLDQWHDESSKNHRPKTAERHEEMVRSHHYRLRIAPDAPTDTPRPQDWVCVRPDGTPISPQTLSQEYDRIRTGLRHIGRYLSPTCAHTHATMPLKAGVPIHVVQARMGHASAQTTIDTYGHALPASDAAAADALLDKLG